MKKKSAAGEIATYFLFHAASSAAGYVVAKGALYLGKKGIAKLREVKEDHDVAKASGKKKSRAG